MWLFLNYIWFNYYLNNFFIIFRNLNFNVKRFFNFILGRNVVLRRSLRLKREIGEEIGEYSGCIVIELI